VSFGVWCASGWPVIEGCSNCSGVEAADRSSHSAQRTLTPQSLTHPIVARPATGMIGSALFGVSAILSGLAARRAHGGYDEDDDEELGSSEDQEGDMVHLQSSKNTRVEHFAGDEALRMLCAVGACVCML